MFIVQRTLVGTEYWRKWMKLMNMNEMDESGVAQSCLTLCDPKDCSPPGSSIHGIFQTRILEWVAISFSRGSSQPRDQTQVSHTAGRLFTIWTTREGNAGLEEAQAGIKISRRNINNHRYADATLVAEGEEELRASWWKWKRRVKKLKTQHSKMNIMASGLITSLQIDGETVRDFIFLGTKIIADWWLQPRNLKMLAPWKKSYDQLSILKSRDITLPTKDHIVKAMVFPVVMYGCESKTIKKAVCQRMDAFELRC